MAAEDYPYLSLVFRLTIDDKTVLNCSECIGLSSELGVEEYAEGGENRFSYKFPTRVQVPNLVLKKGVTSNSFMWEWYVEYLNTGRVALKSGLIELLDPHGGGTEAVKSWSFEKGYPIKWIGPDLNATSNALAFESVEIVHRGIVPKG